MCMYIVICHMGPAVLQVILAKKIKTSEAENMYWIDLGSLQNNCTPIWRTWRCKYVVHSSFKIVVCYQYPRQARDSRE